MAKVGRKDLNLAAAHLQQTIVLQGARVEKTRIRQRKHGLYALATVNGISVETLMPRGMVEWSVIARLMIAQAEESGGVAQVM